MKKIFTLMVGFALVANFANVQAQNLLGNPGFEDSKDGYTVVVGTTVLTDELRRIGSNYSTTTETANPTSTAFAVTDGMWVRRSQSSGYPKGILYTTDYKSGTACMNLRVGAATSATAFTTWNGCVMQQRLSTLANTNKYSLSFWARLDDTAGNVCTGVTVFVVDDTSKPNFTTSTNFMTYLTKTVNITTTTWTKYTVEFNIPDYVSTYVRPVAETDTDPNFTKAYVGIGIATTMDAQVPAKTNHSGVLIDDISLLDLGASTPTAIKTVSDNNFKCVSVIDGFVSSNVDGKIEIFDFSGKKVKNISVVKGEKISLTKGLYLLRGTSVEGVSVQKIVI